VRNYPLGLFLRDRISIPSKLEVDPPHVIWLPMQQYGLVGVKWRVKPKPAVGRESRFYFHVGDQETILEGPPAAVEAERTAHSTTCAIGRDHILCAQRIDAIGRFDLQLDIVIVLREPNDIALPAHLQIFRLLRALGQIAFDVILLEVDERGTRMAGFRQQVERVDQFVLQKRLAHVPAHALFHHLRAAAETIENFQRSFRKANRA
jgi:hypothetical protein